MVRISKQAERRSRSPRKHRLSSKKTVSNKQESVVMFKEHTNAVQGDLASKVFIPKIK